MSQIISSRKEANICLCILFFFVHPSAISQCYAAAAVSEKVSDKSRCLNSVTNVSPAA